jgi:hypothetical protein
LTDTGVGKPVMSATFVTDLCTPLALSAIFIKPNVWFPVFLVFSVALILVLPDRSLVLRALRRSSHRARDQARLRLPAGVDGARGRVERPRRSAGFRARARHEPALHRAPRAGGSTAGSPTPRARSSSRRRAARSRRARRGRSPAA